MITDGPTSHSYPYTNSTRRVDGVPRDEGLMIAIHLDDITACNAPLLAVPVGRDYTVVGYRVAVQRVGVWRVGANGSVKA